jgi:hypothetical protein
MFHVRRGLLGLALVFVAAAAIAEEVGAVVDDSKPATYLVTVHADRTVTIAPFRVVRPGQGPPTSPPNVPPTNPPPGNNPSPFEAQTTGAALSSVYSLVADEVLAGRIEPASALPAIKAATNLVLAKQADAAAWAGWRTSVGDALTQLPLDTKEQMWSALRQVANGLNRATGFNVSPAELVKWDAGRLAVGKADGILDGIDLAQLVELIKLVMELIKLFQGFKP